MARPREFDEREALIRAMHVFWSKGYESTSLPDLLKATGLSRSSLYDTFGSKRELFLAAFEIYRQERMRVLHGYLNSESTAYTSIQGFFLMVLEHARMQERPFGCMSCNEAVEFGPHDPEVQQLVEKDFLGIEDAFTLAIEAGKKDGSIPLNKNARRLARFLTVTLQGLQMMSRSRLDMERLEDATSVMLTTLQ
jgi:TetR/AcrR family transcriptional repressor of nem operon